MWTSPTCGELTEEQMADRVRGFVSEHPERQYAFIVGTDSQMDGARARCRFVTVFIVHRVGNKAIYFYRRKTKSKRYSLFERLYTETALSLKHASELSEQLRHWALDPGGLEVHLDVGQYGKSKDAIQTVMGMVRGCGLTPRIKPESFGASAVADRHTKW